MLSLLWAWQLNLWTAHVVTFDSSHYRNNDYSWDVGRPRLDVRIEDILLLRRLNYSWTKVARMLNISCHILYRLQENGINTSSFTNISESELDQLLSDVKAEHPNTGEVMLQGHLLHLGIKVPRAKLRSAIHHIDHANTICRRSHVINHRVYSAPRPNAVWHIDGNHKMICWRLVIHAGVDGFSHCVVCKQQLCNYSPLCVFGRCISVWWTCPHPFWPWWRKYWGVATHAHIIRFIVRVDREVYT